MIGKKGIERRMIFLIDFGLARSFIVWDNLIPKFRKKREQALLRGTTRLNICNKFKIFKKFRFCSPTVHDRQEQGRRDDIWSLIYLMIELHVGLPWSKKKVILILLFLLKHY